MLFNTISSENDEVGRYLCRFENVQILMSSFLDGPLPKKFGKQATYVY